MVLSTALLPTDKPFNHKTLRLQIQPARYPQMRPQHHVQPLTNPPGHAQEPHERYRCKTTTKPTAATHQPPATETALLSRSLYRSHVLSTFFGPVFGAMMKQVCWHSRRSEACPRPARGQASDAKRNGTRTKQGSRGLESI